MTLYEYKCNKCGNRHDEFHKMGHAVRVTTCPKCGGGSHRVFMVRCIKTDTNNPLRQFGRQLGANMETRADAARVFEARNLVMASERECDSMARDSNTEERRLDKEVADGMREYKALPERLKDADAAKVAKQEAARPDVTAMPMK